MPGPDDGDAGIADTSAVSGDEEDGRGVIDGREARRVEGVPEMEDGSDTPGEDRELPYDLTLLVGERGGPEKTVDLAGKPGGESGDDGEAPLRRDADGERIAEGGYERAQPPGPDAGDPAEEEEFQDAGLVLSPVRS